MTRYSIDMTTWTLKEEKNLINGDTPAFEFPNINPAFQGRRYKYAYLAKNIFKLHGSVAKLNVDNGTIIEDEMPDGMFPTGMRKYINSFLSFNIPHSPLMINCH